MVPKMIPCSDCDRDCPDDGRIGLITTRCPICASQFMDPVSAKKLLVDEIERCWKIIAEARKAADKAISLIGMEDEEERKFRPMVNI